MKKCNGMYGTKGVLSVNADIVGQALELFEIDYRNAVSADVVLNSK